MDSEIQQTLNQFQEAFDSFGKDQLTKEDIKIMFMTMECFNSDHEFDQAFQNMDQDMVSTLLQDI